MLTTCCTPELTSVDNRLETQTHQLVQTLLGVLQGEEMPKKSIFSANLSNEALHYFKVFKYTKNNLWRKKKR